MEPRFAREPRRRLELSGPSSAEPSSNSPEIPFTSRPHLTDAIVTLCPVSNDVILGYHRRLQSVSDSDYSSPPDELLSRQQILAVGDLRHQSEQEILRWLRIVRTSGKLCEDVYRVSPVIADLVRSQP